MIMPEDVTSRHGTASRPSGPPLKDGGFAMADVVRATYYITNAADATRARSLRREPRRYPPAANLLVVAGL